MFPENPKLTTLEELENKCIKWREEGKRIVFGNGIFDILHVGHVRYLKAAKEEGDILIVGINGDEAVRKLKGESRPILTARERALLVGAIRYVDYVFIHEGTDFKDPISRLKPHVHAKGTDYTPETVPEREAVKACGGEVKIVGDPKNHSTSWVIKSLKGR